MGRLGRGRREAEFTIGALIKPRMDADEGTCRNRGMRTDWVEVISGAGRCFAAILSLAQFTSSACITPAPLPSPLPTLPPYPSSAIALHCND